MGIISMDQVWSAYERVTEALGGIRDHVNNGIAQATSGIEKEASKLIDNTHGHESIPITALEKKEVVLLMDKVANGAAVAKWVAVGVSVAAFYALNQTATFSPLLKVTTVISLIVAHEFYQIQNAVSESKRNIDNGITSDQVFWWKESEKARSIALWVSAISTSLATKLLLFNRSSIFGQEIRSIGNYIDRRLVAAEAKNSDAPHNKVKWVPDRTENLITVSKYEEAIKGQVKDFLGRVADTNAPIDSYLVSDYVLEALRPLAFGRAAAFSASLVLYMASAYLPLGWLAFGLSLGTAFAAVELHQAHESLLTEVYKPLIRPYNTSLSEVERLVKNACSRLEDATWLLHKDFLFGKEIKQLPTFLHQLFEKKGDFEDAEVNWVEKSSLTAMIKTLKNWKIYKPQWLLAT